MIAAVICLTLTWKKNGCDARSKQNLLHLFERQTSSILKSKNIIFKSKNIIVFKVIIRQEKIYCFIGLYNLLLVHRFLKNCN